VTCGAPTPPLKNRTTEYMFDPPAPQECVKLSVSALGDPPCWYLSRHTRQQINVGGALRPVPEMRLLPQLANGIRIL